MFRFTGKKLTAADKRMLEDFGYYVMEKFLTPKQIKNTRILVEFISPKKLKERTEQKELTRYLAWTAHYGIFRKKRFLTVTINENSIGKSKNRLTRLGVALTCLGHELIHCKQYIKGEIRDLANGDVKWHGKRYKYVNEGEGYFFSPWEIEAYGYETGLFTCFKELVLNK